MKRSFFGGVHPRSHKDMSTQSSDLRTVIPRQAVIPLSQHIGAPCEPLVKVGDTVLLGQKIGDGEGMCVPVHASVSGTVVAIEPRPHPNGQPVNSIVIDSDGADRAVPFAGCDTPTDALDADAVLHAIREAGIVGMGGAAFPGNVKALSAMQSIDTLIANACECEPYITADDTLLRTAPEQVLEGMTILAHVLTPHHTVLAIEDNKPVAIEILRSLLPNYPGIELRVLPTRYPQGAEKQLIQAVTGRQVPPGGRPTSVGCVVFNVSTFAAIFRAVRLGMPLFERIVTVTGEAVASPQNFTVRIGTPFSDLIEAAGGLRETADRVLSGGPMMGVAQGDLAVPAVKATNSVLCLPREKSRRGETSACIRCGKCLSVCPMHLQPLYLHRSASAARTEARLRDLERLHVLDCMECGSCAYTCPAGLPLVESIRTGKKLVKEASQA